MPLTRRDALARIAGLIAMSAGPPRTLAASAASDPLAGTIADYLAILDAIRGGRAREREAGVRELRQRLKQYA